MLALSQQASDAIKALIESSELPDGAGLRIATSQDVAGDAAPGALALGLAKEPAEDDQVVEEGGANVFLDSEAAEILDDAVLDATVEGDRIGFRVTARS